MELERSAFEVYDRAVPVDDHRIFSVDGMVDAGIELRTVEKHHPRIPAIIQMSGELAAECAVNLAQFQCGIGSSHTPDMYFASKLVDELANGFGGADVLKSMLSVLDDVYRAVEASEKSDDIAALREGEKLVTQKFCDALRAKGVTEIEAQDKEFDADLHEAVARFAAGDDKRGKVIDVVQRGYMLGEKVLRYAKVVVGE